MIYLVQQNKNYGVEFFVRIVLVGPSKQKIGIFIDRMLLKLRLRIEASLKSRFWTEASYPLVHQNKAGGYGRDQ